MPNDLDEIQARNQIGDMLLKASTLAVADEASWFQTRIWRRDIALLYKRAEKWFAEIKEPQNKAIAVTRKKEHEILDPADKVLDLFDHKILEFEKHRVDLRAQQVRDMEQQSRDRAQQARDDQIAQLERRGDQRGADELRKQPLYIPPVVLPDDFVPLPGEGRSAYCEVDEENVDIVALAAAVASGQLPPTAIKPHFPTLHGLADAVGASGKIPGCNIVPVVKITQRAS